MRHAATSGQSVSSVIHYMMYNKMNSYWGISDVVLSCTCFLLLFKITFQLEDDFHVNRENSFA